MNAPGGQLSKPALRASAYGTLSFLPRIGEAVEQEPF
jgi:hypothetical protein